MRLLRLLLLLLSHHLSLLFLLTLLSCESLFFLLIGRWIQNKTYEGLSFERDYKSYFPLAVIKLSENKEEAIPVRDLKENDEIIIRNREIIPADSVLLTDQTHIDYSFVTGEADPVLKKKGDLIYAGGRQMGPAIQLKLQKKVSQSYLTQLWNNEAFEKMDDSGLNNLVNRISKYFTAAIVAIAVLSFVAWQFIDPDKSWFILTAVLIVACPCALSLTVQIIVLQQRQRFPLRRGGGVNRQGHDGR